MCFTRTLPIHPRRALGADEPALLGASLSDESLLPQGALTPRKLDLRPLDGRDPTALELPALVLGQVPLLGRGRLVGRAVRGGVWWCTAPR